jgi:hypothetical protein
MLISPAALTVTSSSVTSPSGGQAWLTHPGQPLTWGGDSWWVSIGDAGVDRFTQIATDNWRRWTLPYQRVDRPPGASDGAVGVTWNDVKATYATWNAVTAAKATWTALNQSVT